MRDTATTCGCTEFERQNRIPLKGWQRYGRGSRSPLTSSEYPGKYEWKPRVLPYHCEWDCLPNGYARGNRKILYHGCYTDIVVSVDFPFSRENVWPPERLWPACTSGRPRSAAKQSSEVSCQQQGERRSIVLTTQGHFLIYSRF